MSLNATLVNDAGVVVPKHHRNRRVPPIIATTKTAMAGLRDAGLVRSGKGHGGSWSLARDPARVSLRFVYLPEQDAYRCPEGQTIKWWFNRVDEHGMTLRHYWTANCPECPIKAQCTPAKMRRVTRWEHEGVLDAMQHHLDQASDTVRTRKQTVEHPFGTLKAWMGSTHFPTRTLKRVGTEMSLHVLAYNMKRVIAILGPGPLMQAIRA